MLPLFTRFLGGSDESAFQREFEGRLAACNAQIQGLQATIHKQHARIERLETTTHNQHARIERLRAEAPWPPLEAFHFFPQLPVELRQMIWKYALRRPRLVRLSNSYKSFDPRTNDRVTWFVDRRDGSGIARADGFPWLHEFGATSAPPLFSVCQESRGIALPMYDFALLPYPSQTSTVIEIFRPRNSPDANHIMKPISYPELTQRRAYFRPDQDTVSLNSETHDIFRFLDDARADELETRNIKSLAIPLLCFDSLARRLLGYEAPFLCGLVELILVTSENSQYLDSNTRGMSVAPRYIEEQMRSRQQKDPQMRFPVVKVMTESMLEAYVEGKKASPRPAKRKASPWANPRPAKERSLPWARNSQ